MRKGSMPEFCSECTGQLCPEFCHFHGNRPTGYINKVKNNEDTKKLEETLLKSIETGQDFYGISGENGLEGDFIFLDGEPNVQGDNFSITYEKTPHGTIEIMKIGGK
jgi:hypothetical protein